MDTWIAPLWACVGLKKSDVRMWFALKHPSNVAMDSALTRLPANEERLSKLKRGRFNSHLPKSYQNPPSYKSNIVQ